MSLNMNQFKQNQIVGQVDLQTNPNPAIYTERIDPDSSGADIVSGTGVKLVDGGANDPGGAPLIDERTADSDAIEGVIVQSTQQGKFQPEDVVEVAGKGAVVVMEASAAILRGADVALVLATAGQVVTATTETVLGTCLDKASASGDLVRVRIGG